jgi:hypothetical protein
VILAGPRQQVRHHCSAFIRASQLSRGQAPAVAVSRRVSGSRCSAGAGERGGKWKGLQPCRAQAAGTAGVCATSQDCGESRGWEGKEGFCGEQGGAWQLRQPHRTHTSFICYRRSGMRVSELMRGREGQQPLRLKQQVPQ